MADQFIDLGIETDSATLADAAIDNLKARFPGWEPNDGDLHVVLIEVLAAMAADVAMTAALMPSTAMRAFLELLHGIPYGTGSSAATTVTFSFTDDNPHDLRAGWEIDIDGHSFRLDDDVHHSGGPTLGGVSVTAAEHGVEYNDLSGERVVPITAISFVDSVVIDAPTSGGVDPESMDDYQDRGSRELELQSRTLVTARDYELKSLSHPSVDRVVTTVDNAARTVVVTVSDDSGGALTDVEKAALAADFEDLRQSNWQVSMVDAVTTTINVTYTVHLYPGFVAGDALARIDSEIASFLDPAAWGRPHYEIDDRRWYVEPRVRKNKLIDLIGSIQGVDYVGDVTITGSAGSAQSNGDWLMPGAVPLTTPGTIAGTII